MKITLKLYASLGKHLPDHAVRGEADIEVTAGITLEGILKAHDVPLEHCHLVLVNGHYIAPSQRAEKVLEDGDALAVWPPVAGGSGMPGDVVIEKEMGITHAEFFRNILRALGTDDYTKDDHRVTLQGADKSLEISISPQGERRIALFVLPVTHVTLNFRGYGQAEVTSIIAAFDRAFQRGGG